MDTRASQLKQQADLELLSAYLDGELLASEKAALERRIAVEPALRTELETLRATVGLLRDLPPVGLPRSFTLDPAQVRRRSRAPFAAWGQLIGGLATTVVVMFGLIYAFIGIGGVPGSAPSQVGMLPATTTLVAPWAAATNAPAAVAVAPDMLSKSAPPATSADSAPAAEQVPLATAAATPQATARADNTRISGMTQPPYLPTQAMAEATAARPAGESVVPAAANPYAGAGNSQQVQATSNPITTAGASSPGTVTLAPPAVPPPNGAPQPTAPPPFLLIIGVLLVLLVLIVVGVLRRRVQK